MFELELQGHTGELRFWLAKAGRGQAGNRIRDLPVPRTRAQTTKQLPNTHPRAIKLGSFCTSTTRIPTEGCV